MSTKWIVTFPARAAGGESPRLRFFCFPPAGSGAKQFNPWRRVLPDGVELNAIQLPGRESRLRETPNTEAGPVTRELCAAMGDYLDAPYVFLGHSLGALLAFETIRALRAAGKRLPLRLFVIGRRAPHLPPAGELLHRLPDERLLAWIRRAGGTPEPVLETPELMELYLPALRADLQLNETYHFAPEQPLELPISCFGGIQDELVSRRELEAWAEHTMAGCRVRMYPGGHFFLNEYRATVLRDVGEDLAW